MALLNSVIYAFIREFWNNYTKNLGKYKENSMQWSCILTMWIKALLQVLFWKCSEVKTFVPFFPTSTAWSPKFATSTRTGSNKNVSCGCSEIVEKLPGKGLKGRLWFH